MKSKKKKTKKAKIGPGSVVVFEPTHFNPKFWDGLTEKEKKKYYGPLGYGAKSLNYLFIFVL